MSAACLGVGSSQNARAGALADAWAGVGELDWTRAGAGVVAGAMGGAGAFGWTNGLTGNEDWAA